MHGFKKNMQYICNAQRNPHDNNLYHLVIYFIRDHKHSPTMICHRVGSITFSFSTNIFAPFLLIFPTFKAKNVATGTRSHSDMALCATVGTSFHWGALTLYSSWVRSWCRGCVRRRPQVLDLLWNFVEGQVVPTHHDFVLPSLVDENTGPLV